MAVTVLDAASAAASSFGAASLTFSYTVSAGADLLVVRVVSGQGGAALSVTGVTFGGTACFSIGASGADGAALSKVSVWALRSPAATTADVVVTASAAADIIIATASSYDGVDITSDASTHAGTFASEVDGADGSLTISTASGDMAIDVLQSFAASATVGAGQTLEINANPGNNTHIHTSREAATGASVVMSWSALPSFWAYAAVAIKAASGTAGASVKTMHLHRQMRS
jgi:hypothetical protein